MSTRASADQEKRYKNLNFSVAIKKDNIGIIKNFIESEKEAYEYGFQGVFYPLYHDVLQRVLNTKMTRISEEDIFLAYYYRLKLGIADKTTDRNYSLLLNAVKKIHDEKSRTVHGLSSACLYLLFGISDGVNFSMIEGNDYQTYSNILAFKTLCNSYFNFPGLRNKSKRFSIFLNDSILMDRIRKGFQSFFERDFVSSGSLVLLLLDTEQKSKESLLQLHKNNLTNKQVWFLGSFYKGFQDSDVNKKILEDLYLIYPKIWVDEYQ